VFRTLQERCDGLSPTVLNDRLREPRAVGIVTVHADGRYALTDDRRTLGAMLIPLNRWVKDWARRRLRRRAQ